VATHVTPNLRVANTDVDWTIHLLCTVKETFLALSGFSGINYSYLNLLTTIRVKNAPKFALKFFFHLYIASGWPYQPDSK
jgi:hypothetical protein